MPLIPEFDPCDPFNPQTIEQCPKLHRVDIIVELRRMADAAGWTEIGGRLVRDRYGNACGRTQWIPREAWFAEKPTGTGKRDFREAVDRIELDLPLTACQRRALAHMLTVINDNEMSEL